MPAFGTYRLTPEVATAMTRKAIMSGITHIDTAQLYGNEAEVYSVVREYPGVALTTKIHRKLIKQADRDNRAIENSVLGLNIPKQILLHSPEKNFVVAWEQLSRMSSVDTKIGVSNFDIVHLKQLEGCAVRPSVNQLEVTPFNLCSETVAYCRDNNIQVEAHSALIKGELMDSAVMHEFASMYKVTPAQLLIQWSLDQGFIPIFSSKNPSHVSELSGLRKNVISPVHIPLSCNIGYRTHPQYLVR